jgi:hypothetical protein
MSYIFYLGDNFLFSDPTQIYIGYQSIINNYNFFKNIIKNIIFYYSTTTNTILQNSLLSVEGASFIDSSSISLHDLIYNRLSSGDEYIIYQDFPLVFNKNYTIDQTFSTNLYSDSKYKLIVLNCNNFDYQIYQFVIDYITSNTDGYQNQITWSNLVINNYVVNLLLTDLATTLTHSNKLFELIDTNFIKKVYIVTNDYIYYPYFDYDATRDSIIMYDKSYANYYRKLDITPNLIKNNGSVLITKTFFKNFYPRYTTSYEGTLMKAKEMTNFSVRKDIQISKIKPDIIFDNWKINIVDFPSNDNTNAIQLNNIESYINFFVRISNVVINGNAGLLLLNNDVHIVRNIDDDLLHYDLVLFFNDNVTATDNIIFNLDIIYVSGSERFKYIFQQIDKINKITELNAFLLDNAMIYPHYYYKKDLQIDLPKLQYFEIKANEKTTSQINSNTNGSKSYTDTYISIEGMINNISSNPLSRIK